MLLAKNMNQVQYLRGNQRVDSENHPLLGLLRLKFFYFIKDLLKIFRFRVIITK